MVDTSYYLFSLMALFGALAGNAGNDLLDYLPLDAYWQSQQVQVTPEAMVNLLKPPAPVDVAEALKDLASDDAETRDRAMRKIQEAGPGAAAALTEASNSDNPELASRARALLGQIEQAGHVDNLRRLAALRTLGELRKVETIPQLEPLLTSREPFIADYARAAIASIRGEPFVRGRPADLGADVWLLPRECRVVARFTPDDRPFPISTFLRDVKPPPGQTVDLVTAPMVSAIAGLGQSIGNIRIDGMTLGVSGDIGIRSGFLVLIVRGQYDSVAINQMMAKQHVPARTVEGFQIFANSSDVAVIFASNERMVLIAAPRNKDLYADGMAAVLKAGAGTLQNVPEMTKLIGAVDTTSPLWIAGLVTDAFRPVPFLGSFDQVILTSRRGQDSAISFTLAATGSDAAKAKEAADGMTAALEGLKNEVKASEAGPDRSVSRLRHDVFGPFLNSVQVQAAGKQLSATGTLKVSPGTILNAVMDQIWTNSADRPGPPPVPPPPPQ